MVSRNLQREIDDFMVSTPRSKGFQEEASRYLPGGSTRGAQYFDPYPALIERGEGHYIYDVDGNRYLDFMINATSLILGHAHPDVVNALQEQAAKGLAFSGPTESQARVAKILSDRVPSIEKLRFVNSGTEGTLMALRAARAFTGKHKFAKFEGGYHGSAEALAISVSPSADKLDPSGPTAIPESPGMPPGLLDDVLVLPYNDIETCERLIRAQKDELACVMMEVVASAFGYTPGSPEFLKGIRELTDELGIILIFDEVQSLRLSSGGAQELLGVTPDMTAMGKIIGGGMPVGAFGGREDIMAVLDPTEGGAILGHAGTFNGNPMTMAAGEVTLNHLTPEVYQRLNALGETLRMKLRAVFDEMEVPVQVTGIGSLFGVHFTSEEITDYRSVVRGDRQMRRALFMGLVNEGIMPSGSGGGALNVLTTESEVDDLVGATRQVVERIRD